MRLRLLRDIYSAFESGEPAYRADAIDEYRELAMLAHAWERGSLEPGVAEGAPGRRREGAEQAPAAAVAGSDSCL